MAALGALLGAAPAPSERLGYLELRADPTNRRSKRIAVVGVIHETVGEVEAAWAR